MKKLNAVRWAAFLVTLLANADAVEAKMMVAHTTHERSAKCEQCGRTGPTVPIVPVVFRGHAAAGFEAPHAPRSASLWPDVRAVRLNAPVPVRDEFGPDSPRPTVGTVFTR